MTVTRLSRTAGLVILITAPLVQAAESLAPPHAPLIEGQTVPVTAYPDQQALLENTNRQLATNKRRVYDFWRTVILGGRAQAVDAFLSPEFVEHNPLLPNGKAAFTDYVGSNIPTGAIPNEIPDLVTLVAEGPYVVMARIALYPDAEGSSPDAEGSGTNYTSTHFDMFRLEAGLVAEHWDSTLFRAGQRVPDYGDNMAAPVLGVSGSAQLAQLDNADPQLFANKRLAFDLWRHIPEGGREELAALYLDPIYIQHNPNAATGREGFKVYFSRRPETPVESFLEAPLVAMVAENDLVVQVLETEREQDGVTYKVPWFDMYRMENGRVIEHWDTASKGELPAIMQGIPMQGLP